MSHNLILGQFSDGIRSTGGGAGNNKTNNLFNLSGSRGINIVTGSGLFADSNRVINNTFTVNADTSAIDFDNDWDGLIKDNNIKHENH